MCVHLLCKLCFTFDSSTADVCSIGADAIALPSTGPCGYMGNAGKGTIPCPPGGKGIPGNGIGMPGIGIGIPGKGMGMPGNISWPGIGPPKNIGMGGCWPDAFVSVEVAVSDGDAFLSPSTLSSVSLKVDISLRLARSRSSFLLGCEEMEKETRHLICSISSADNLGGSSLRQENSMRYA